MRVTTESTNNGAIQRASKASVKIEVVTKDEHVYCFTADNFYRNNKVKREQPLINFDYDGRTWSGTFQELANLLKSLTEEPKPFKGSNFLVNRIREASTEEEANAVYSSWHETHFEVATKIAELGDMFEFYPWYKAEIDKGGTGRMWEIAEQITNEFEAINQGKEWDGEFYEALEEFTLEFLKKGHANE